MQTRMYTDIMQMSGTGTEVLVKNDPVILNKLFDSVSKNALSTFEEALLDQILIAVFNDGNMDATSRSVEYSDAPVIDHDEETVTAVASGLVVL